LSSLPSQPELSARVEYSRPISVVIPALNEAAYLPGSVARFLATLPAGSEVLVVDDGSTDGGTDFLRHAASASRAISLHLLSGPGQGVASARNCGGFAARGRVLVFADAHIDLPEDWWPPLLAALDRPGVGAVAPAIAALGQPERRGYGMTFTGPDLNAAWLGLRGRAPYAVPLLCGAFLAVRRDVFVESGGFDAGMLRWGAEDLEFSLRLWLLGYQVLLVPQVAISHLFRSRHPYTVDWAGVVHNLLRMAWLHLSTPRLERVLAALQPLSGFNTALARLAGGDTPARRLALAASRRYSDDWFFSTFGIAC